MNVDNPSADDVKMIILDSVVMAPTVNNIDYLDIKLILTCTCKHCAFQKCTKDLENARGGAFVMNMKYSMETNVASLNVHNLEFMIL